MNEINRQHFISLIEKILPNDNNLNSLQPLNHSIQAPLIECVDNLLNIAINMKVSDLHLEPYNTFIRIRFRIDGFLQENFILPSKIHSFLVARLKILAKMDIVEKRKPQDGSFIFNFNKDKVDIRISIIPTLYGEKVVLRFFILSNQLPKLNELSFNQENLLAIKKLLTRGSGLIINAGPVNSGKTTTLYAALSSLDTTKQNIVTVEDPIEYRLDNITQVQVNNEIGLSFAQILRSFLRQDPDVIMIGEIRDQETARLAIQFALTGRKVLTTLHADNCAKAILRLLDMGIEPYLLNSALAGCISQRLVRKLCPFCADNLNQDEEALSFCQKYNINLNDNLSALGCDNCLNTGYKGRIALQEVLIWNDEHQKGLLENIHYPNLLNKNNHLLQDGIDKIKLHLTNSYELQRIFRDA